ncbi:putative permease [Streptomyces sp. NBRC 110611]|nr:putative permease [Streptomyces sp. NBRC 110611]
MNFEDPKENLWDLRRGPGETGETEGDTGRGAAEMQSPNARPYNATSARRRGDLSTAPGACEVCCAVCCEVCGGCDASYNLSSCSPSYGPPVTARPPGSRWR